MIAILKSKLVENADVLISMQSGIVTYVNPFSYLKLRKKITMQEFDYITSDGIVVKKLSGVFLNRSVQRISPDFSSYFTELFKQVSSSNSTVYFVGTLPELIGKSIENIKDKFPTLNIVGFRDGYFKNTDDLNKHIKEIISLNPEFLIVGMGSPLQEDYLINLKHSGWKGRGFACGGFLHQVSKKADYYPNWINKMNLRWLYRIYNEPKLIKRYTLDYTWFLFVFIYDWVGYKFSKK